MYPDEYGPLGIAPANHDGFFGAPAPATLLPQAVIALGGAERPVERLMALQSAIARAVHLASPAGWPRLKLPRLGGTNLRFRLFARNRLAAPVLPPHS